MRAVESDFCGADKLVKIAVVIPCYNGERWVAAAIDSVLAQNCQALEIIVVDDGSTDRTASVLKGFGSRIAVLTQQNCGVSAARNAGARFASGTHLKFLDADDLMPAGALEALTRVAEAHRGMVIVGRAAAVDQYGVPTQGESGYDIGCRLQTGELIDPSYLITQATSSSLWLLPKIVFLESGGFDTTTRLGEELCFTKELIRAGAEFVFLDREISLIRNHDGERLSRAGGESDYLRVLQEIEGCLNAVASQYPVAPDARLRIARMCWMLGRHCLRSGFQTAAGAFFSYARSVAGAEAINGSAIYRLLQRLMGPDHAEHLLQGAKRTMSRH